MNKSIIIGKRIPIGAAITGIITFAGDLWNTIHPDMALSVAAWGGLAAAITALAQIVVVNTLGVTHAKE